MEDKLPGKRNGLGPTARITQLERTVAPLEKTVAYHGQSIAALTGMINQYIKDQQWAAERMARIESANEEILQLIANLIAANEERQADS